MKKVFFYGLFMDEGLLTQQGIVPASVQKAWVEDYELVISKRASLVASYGHRAFGQVMSLRQEDLDLLYGAEGLEDYKPEKLTAKIEGGVEAAVLCYNLPKHLLVGANKDYAEKLFALVKSLGAPRDYLAHIKSYY